VFRDTESEIGNRPKMPEGGGSDVTAPCSVQVAPITNPAGSETAAEPACLHLAGRQTVETGSGVSSSSSSTAVAINTTDPGDNTWFDFEGNGSGSSATMTGCAVCALP